MEFKINQVYMDSKNKDYVMVTNGTDKDGIFLPTEGIVIRAFSADCVEGFKLYWTYIGVDPKNLSETAGSYTKEKFHEMINQCVGRI